MPIRRPSTNNYNQHQSWTAAETRYSFFHFARRLEIESPQLPSWESRMGDERRRTPRYPFIATAEEVDQSTQASIATRVTDPSLNASYWDSPNPPPKAPHVRIKLYTHNKFS